MKADAVIVSAGKGHRFMEGRKKQMGKTVDVIVTSVLQTPAGRMIFARMKEETSRETKGKDYYYPLDSEF